MDRNGKNEKRDGDDQPHRNDAKPEREKGKERKSRGVGESRERERENESRAEVEQEFRMRQNKNKEKVEDEIDLEGHCTVFAYQISLKANESDICKFFSRAGKVRDARLIIDRNSGRSKGIGFIEFYDAKSVSMAIALSGQPLLGQPVLVKPSEAEKNLVQSNIAAGFIGAYSMGPRRLYIGNLHSGIREDRLRQVFEPFGIVELVQLPLDDSGHCIGFGFVQFARLEDAIAAQSSNRQLIIDGKMVDVLALSDQVGMRDIGPSAIDLDIEDDGRGLALNAHSRALLMQKLDRSGTTSSISGSLTSTPANGFAPTIAPLLPGLGGQVPAPAGLPGAAGPLPIAPTAIDTIGIPSECLLLKNMFDPHSETQPDFDSDIKQEVEAECSKFGMVTHVFVDKNSAGFVYLRFGNVQSAISAQRVLHGRWYAKRRISATFMMPKQYEEKFPNSPYVGLLQALNAHSRALLKQKLDRSGTTSSISGSLNSTPANGFAPTITPLLPGLGGQVPAPAGLPGAAGPLPIATTAIDTIGIPSECLLLKNMFDPHSETQPDFDSDIKQEVEEECSKFGMVKHVFVDNAGFVYLRFGNVQSAISAQRVLHGRWYAKRSISATFMMLKHYEDKFPNSK